MAITILVTAFGSFPGARANPTIAISANHGVNYVRGLLACILSDGIVVPINPSATSSENLHILQNSTADALLLEQALRKKAL